MSVFDIKQGGYEVNERTSGARNTKKRTVDECLPSLSDSSAGLESRVDASVYH